MTLFVFGILPYNQQLKKIKKLQNEKSHPFFDDFSSWKYVRYISLMATWQAPIGSS